jgi:hypothetical protein
MSYGGVDAVEIDEEYGYFYVHRDAGYWNRYSLGDSADIQFLDWCYQHEDIPIVALSDNQSENNI